jgi:hypothetical protein
VQVAFRAVDAVPAGLTGVAHETEYGGDVSLEYHSFELAPELPADYCSSEADFLQFLYAGTTRAGAEQMMWVVRGTGARLGLAYDFDRGPVRSSHISCSTVPRPMAARFRCSTSSLVILERAATCAGPTSS